MSGGLTQWNRNIKDIYISGELKAGPEVASERVGRGNDTVVGLPRCPG